MRTLICGSLAFDTIMVFPDRFARHILPEQTHMLSVSFQISDMRREWGGCAGNIGYNLRALGGEPVIMGTLGSDGGAYRDRLRELDIAIDGLRMIDDAYTAQAFIITDHDDNQITAFHPGAMNRSHVNRVTDMTGIGLGIISPDGKEGMQQHAREFAALRIPFIFDPGQGLPLFNNNELAAMIEDASYLTVNDYEAQMVQERTGGPCISRQGWRDPGVSRVDRAIQRVLQRAPRLHRGGRSGGRPEPAVGHRKHQRYPGRVRVHLGP